MNRNIQNKLLNYEEEPPAEAWDHISKALDKESEHSITNKLYHFEQTPPAAAWIKISGLLDKEETFTIPFFKQLRGSIKYAAAILALALISIAIYITRKNPSNIASHVSKALSLKRNNLKTINKQQQSDNKAATTSNSNSNDKKTK